MTNEEAIEAIKLAISEVEWEYPLDYAAAFDMAIEALEKQIPKRPIGGIDSAGNEYEICCECSAIVEDSKWRASFCPDCGQALDWSGENERS